MSWWREHKQRARSSRLRFINLTERRAGFFALFCAFSGAALAADPRPAPGLDPGGVAVAIISDGLDYTRPDIAARLARDGEGEIVGFDFADNDRYPFDASGAGTELARLVAAEAPAARIAPVRVPAQDAKALAKSLAFVARSPVRVALFAGRGGRQDGGWRSVQQMTMQIGGVLFVVPAGDESADLDHAGVSEATGNVIVVTASDGAGAILTAANRGAKSVDVAAPAASSSLAAARIAALAARIAEAEPESGGAALKTRVLSLAAVQPSGATSAGWIAEPARRR